MDSGSDAEDNFRQRGSLGKDKPWTKEDKPLPKKEKTETHVQRPKPSKKGARKQNMGVPNTRQQNMGVWNRTGLDWTGPDRARPEPEWNWTGLV